MKVEGEGEQRNVFVFNLRIENERMVKMSKDTDRKVEKKVAKIDRKTARKTGKCAVWIAAALVGLMATGCATVGQDTAQPNDQASLQAGKSETITATFQNSQIINIVGAKKVEVDPVVKDGATNALVKVEMSETAETYDISILSQAQSMKSEGTETFSPSNAPQNTPDNKPTATPTNEVKTDLKFTYGLTSESAAGTSWLQDLTSASCKGLAAWLGSGTANGEMVVTKENGQTEKVTCVDGKCTNQNGDVITCSGGACSPGGTCPGGTCSPQ